MGHICQAAGKCPWRTEANEIPTNAGSDGQRSVVREVKSPAGFFTSVTILKREEGVKTTGL